MLQLNDYLFDIKQSCGAVFRWYFSLLHNLLKLQNRMGCYAKYKFNYDEAGQEGRETSTRSSNKILR